MNKYDELLKKYNCELNDAQVAKEVDSILEKHMAENMRSEVYKQCLNLIDLTSLNSTDTDEQIFNMVQKVNKFEESYPDIPNIGAICVYPNFVSTVKENLTEDIGIEIGRAPV